MILLNYIKFITLLPLSCHLESNTGVCHKLLPVLVILNCEFCVMTFDICLSLNCGGMFPM